MSIEFFNESGLDGVNEEMLIDVASFALGAMDVNPDRESTMTCGDLGSIEEVYVGVMDLARRPDVRRFRIDELLAGALGRRSDAPEMGPVVLGDSVLGRAFAERQADAAGHSLSDELALLTLHGCLQ